MEVQMAQEFHSVLPHVDFKAVNRFDPEDYGRRCRVTEIREGKHMLAVKSKNGFINLDQAPFATVAAAISWANLRYSMDGNLDS